MRACIFVAVVLSSIIANAAPSIQAQQGAYTIVDRYNRVKANVGVSYQLSAGPQLACLGKVFVAWARSYDQAVRLAGPDVAASEDVARMRRLMAEVDNDTASFEEFIRGLLPIVGTAMDNLGINAPTEMALADPKGPEYLAKLHKCRSKAFYNEVEKLAQDSGVELKPQTLTNDRVVDFLFHIWSR